MKKQIKPSTIGLVATTIFVFIGFGAGSMPEHLKDYALLSFVIGIFVAFPISTILLIKDK